jgi:hypothetical protein
MAGSIQVLSTVRRLEHHPDLPLFLPPANKIEAGTEPASIEITNFSLFVPVSVECCLEISFSCGGSLYRGWPRARRLKSALQK